MNTDAAQMACQTTQSCEQARISRYPAEIYSCGSLENISPAVLLHQPAPQPLQGQATGLASHTQVETIRQD